MFRHIGPGLETRTPTAGLRMVGLRERIRRTADNPKLMLTRTSLLTLPLTLAAIQISNPVLHAQDLAAPVRVEAAGKPISVEEPGYASPCWHDVDGDGRADLVVGQYADGKMMVYRSTEDGKFAKGEWLQADGKVAMVPGIW